MTDQMQPPVLTTEQYERDKARGIVRVGKPVRSNVAGELERY